MITLQDIEDARQTIRSEANKTPLVRSRFLSDLCGGEVHLKLENLQVTNSFKIRGALNRMMHLKPEEMRRGVVAASSGNHAQAVAIGAEKLNIAATVVVPEATPKIKIEKIRKHKVQLILHGKIYDLAEQYARELARKEGSTFISAYNDPYVVAGAGTVGLEILEDLPTVNSIIVPVSGGSLLSGIATVAKSMRSSIEVLGVQPENTPAMYYSLKAGKITDVEMRHTIADGLDGNIEHGSVTFEIIRKYVDEVLLFDEETIRKAIRLLWEKERQVAEGSGAIAIAPIIRSPERYARKRTVAVISGGNIDEAVFQSILASGALSSSS
jgi:threonine dehydratase